MGFYETTIRVRYAETDQMGVVYYANYLVWFEIGRAELLRSINIPANHLEEDGIFLPVLESHCRYIHSARYDDEVTIKKSSHAVNLIKSSSRGYFEILRTKLKWGAR